MSNYYAGNIIIGGTLSSSKSQGLIDAINKQKCSYEYGGGVVSVEDVSDLLSYRNEKGYLEFCDDEIRYGEFGDIESYCVSSGISFIRKTESGCDFGPERVEFFQGMDAPKTYTTDTDGNIVVPLYEVQKLFEFVKGKHTRKELNKRIKDFDEKFVPSPIEMSPFEIVTTNKG